LGKKGLKERGENSREVLFLNTGPRGSKKGVKEKKIRGERRQNERKQGGVPWATTAIQQGKT